MPTTSRYRIHPAIGIARVGSDPADFFLGPERPNQLPQGGPRFKTGGRIRRQAQRFRVFEYTESGGAWTAAREITADLADVVELTWTVHLANRKASFFTFNGLAGSPVLARQPRLRRRNRSVGNRRRLEIDPLPRSIAGPSAGPVEFRRGSSANPAGELWPDPAPTPALDYLGELRTDALGRLMVLGGLGIAARQPSASDVDDYANNDGWFDDVSDGPVSAVLRLNVGGTVETVPVLGAWVLVGPPDFAPGLPPVVSLWDVLFDLAVTSLTLPADETAYRVGGDLARLHLMATDLAGGATAFTSYRPTFDDDIAPILRQALAPSWTLEPAQHTHRILGGPTLSATGFAELSDPATATPLRQRIFSRVRRPGTAGLLTGDSMPHLLGDDPYNKFRTKRWALSLTTTQYAILEAWSRGQFIGTTRGIGALAAPPVPAGVTAEGLDRAALENCAGGAFYPGIEVGWQIRDPALYVEPFRIRHGARSRYIGERAGRTVTAGHFSRQMALPWHADFLQCKQEEQTVTHGSWGWWPTQRPDDVYETFAVAQTPPRPPATGMVPWHRATTGTSNDWPADAGGPAGRPATMPSYAQLLEHWEKLGFVVVGPGGAHAEVERAGGVP